MNEIKPLTGIRGVAAMLVVAYHLLVKGMISDLGQKGIAVDFPAFLHKGYVGVDLFFVLSGFLLSHIYERTFDDGVRRTDYVRFLIRRIARIYPAYICIMALSVVRHIISVHDQQNFHMSVVDIAANLLMIQAWWPGFNTTLGVSWSLSAELFAYITMPFMLLGMYRTMRSGAKAITVVVVVCIACLQLMIALNDNKTIDITSPPFCILRALADFYLGVAAVHCIRQFEFAQKLVASSYFVVLSTVVAVLLLEWSNQDIFIIISFVILVASLSGGAAAANFMYGNRIVYFLGEISYSVYLIHTLLIASAYMIEARLSQFGWPLAVSLSCVTAVGLIIAAASASYFVIERPARELFRQLQRLSKPTLRTGHAKL
jgi:peptidoglycan/LPS O-acetylase OafA/YrhL